jgi:hypothetical protein
MGRRRPGSGHRRRLDAAAHRVVTTQPLSVGGKGAGADNDRFHGTVDDVWIRIG